MNVSEIFIRRPIATLLLMFALVLFGVMGYRALPISDLPNVDFPTIQVSASLPGASPETMASAVATPLERQFSTIDGIDSMSSSSSQGQTQITLQFNLNRDIDSAAQDVQSAITAASRQLPAEMPNPPTYRKVNPAASPILYVALSSSTLPLSLVNRYAETFLAQRISMVSGVAQVNVFGSQKYAVRVQLDPDRLATYQLGLEDVSNAISQGNVNAPTGSLDGQRQSFLVQTDGQLTDATAFQSLIVAYRNGAPIYLNRLGNVIDSVENNKNASWFNGTRAMILAIQRQPGTNTIAVVDGIKKLLPTFQQQLPAGINMKIMYDRSESIRASVHDVQFTLILAAILVVFIIFLFLRNFAATFIPSIALPLSVIATFAVMHQFNFSLDNLSLLGLTLVVGFVVDDAIVMLENIFRHKEMGKSALDAALQGSQEIGFTIISMTISLAVVFIPVLFMGGILGRLLHEFAITIITAILLSGIISLTLTPMLCSKLLTKDHEITQPSSWLDKFNFERITEWYDKTLQWTLKHHRFTLGIFFFTLILSAILFAAVPKGFLPSEDTGQIFGYTEADPAVSFAEMVNRQQKVADIIRKDPNVEHLMSSVGAGGPTSTANAGRIFMKLKPRKERPLAADDIIKELRQKVSHVPGIKVYLQNIAAINVGRLTKSTYQYTLQSSDNAELNHWASIFLQRMQKLPGFDDVTSDQQFTGPQVHLSIDRDKASKLGISAGQIEDTLNNAYGTRQVSTIYTPIDTYKVILELLPDAQRDPDALLRLYVRTNTNKLVPLREVVTITQESGPLTVNHQGQLASVTISFALKQGYSLGNAVNAIDKLKAELHPPATLIGGFQGTAQAFQSSMQGLGLLLIMAILVIYIVLGMLYESFIHPLTILSGLPTASAGALLSLFLFHIDLNFYSFLGMLMLIGIVKKNAIIMIDFAIEARRKENKSPFDAIYSACLVRFRPIMMTTMAAIMGILPIALAFGAGAESRRPLGIAVVGGLLVSQLLTLYITPVIYLYFEALSERVGRWRKGEAYSSTQKNTLI